MRQKRERDRVSHAMHKAKEIQWKAHVNQIATSRVCIRKKFMIIIENYNAEVYVCALPPVCVAKEQNFRSHASAQNNPPTPSHSASSSSSKS